MMISRCYRVGQVTSRRTYYFVPDAYTHQQHRPLVPAAGSWTGRSSGCRFQMNISGFVANASLAESVRASRLPGQRWTRGPGTTGPSGICRYDRPGDRNVRYLGARRLRVPIHAADVFHRAQEAVRRRTDQRPCSIGPRLCEAWEYLINKIHVHKTSPPADQTKEARRGVSATRSAAGKIGLWPSGRVYSTGYRDSAIKDRFEWTLLPAVTAPGGGPPVHSWSDQREPRHATAALRLRLGGGVDIYWRCFWLARSTRAVSESIVGICRCTRPRLAPESLTPPPEGMKWLKYYADRPDNRSLFPVQHVAGLV